MSGMGVGINGDRENSGAGVRSQWLGSGWLDTVFIANIFWPLLLLPALRVGDTTAVSFWQVYFVTLPHRWLTLALVALDPDRRAGSVWKLSLALVLPGALVVVAWWVSGGLVCLAMIDFAWNAWHFGSQHAGISRAYALKRGDRPSSFERWGLRGLVVFALARPVEWVTGWVEGGSPLDLALRFGDWAALGTGVVLLAANLSVPWSGRLGKNLHLVSLVSLYCGLVAAVHWGWSGALVPLLTASAWMHASEYIAFVGIYARGRGSRGGAGPIQPLAGQMVAWMMVFITVVGSIGWMLEIWPSSAAFWGTLNLWAALSHYGLDGIIWKLRQPGIRAVLSAGPGG